MLVHMLHAVRAAVHRATAPPPAPPMRTDLAAVDRWLGHRQLTVQQRDRFIAVWDDVTARYPDDPATREHVLIATVNYLHDVATPASAASEVRRLSAELRAAKAVARALTLLAFEDGATEAAVHHSTGLPRRSLRRWLAGQ